MVGCRIPMRRHKGLLNNVCVFILPRRTLQNMQTKFAVILAFKPAGAINGSTVFGKVGPFEKVEKIEVWCRTFRDIARERKCDITAFPEDNLAQLSTDFSSLNPLPSNDAQEIINHAITQNLFGM